MSKIVNIETRFSDGIFQNNEQLIDSSSKLSLKIEDGTEILGIGIPDWAVSSFKVASFVFSALEAQSTAKFREEVRQALQIIYAKLEHIEERIEDLHLKVDNVLAGLSVIEETVLSGPQREALNKAEALCRRWILGEKWTDIQFCENYEKIEQALHESIGDKQSKWSSLNIPRILEVGNFISNNRFDYCQKRALLDESPEDAPEMEKSRRLVLLAQYRELMDGLTDNIVSASKSFRNAWNASSPGRDFGLGKSDRSLKASWDVKHSSLNDVANGLDLEDDHFLRRVRLRNGAWIKDLNFSYLGYVIPKSRKCHFSLFHVVEFDRELGIFVEVSPMLIFPSKGVDLGVSSLPVNVEPNQKIPEFKLIGENRPPLEDWTSTFPISEARRQNRIFKDLVKGHEAKMKRELARINEALKLLVLLSLSRPLMLTAIKKLSQ